MKLGTSMVDDINYRKPLCSAPVCSATYGCQAEPAFDTDLPCCLRGDAALAVCG